ncbi:MAG: hypothetical protein FJ399_04750 [Verrucomicrobia bacterium]|nr:hypothetical protein [Verrucomicrobiota bacterium]
MPMATPTFDPTLTITGRNSIITLTIGGTPTSLLGKLLDYQRNLDMGRLMAPGASNGPVYTARTWVKSRVEIFKFEVRELSKLITLLGSMAGKKDGTCTVWVRDPDDAANVAALKTDDFACSVYAEGDVRFGEQGESVATLVIESRKDGDITFTPDAATT